MFDVPLSASMRFTEAAGVFLASCKAPETPSPIRFISKRTYDDYQSYLKTLGIFFGELPLNEIHLGHIRQYQRKRSMGDGFTRVIGNKKGREPVPSPAGAAKINAEISVLKKLMTMTGSWTPELAIAYKRYQVDDGDIEPALSPQEQDHFLSTAASNPEWYPVWWYALVALHVTFSSDEMRTIRIGDINLTFGSLSVNRKFGKNKNRRRTVAIEDPDCLYALERLIERAKELGGGTRPNHHLFPFCVHSNGNSRTYDHERPMGDTGLRKPFQAVRAAAGLPWFKLNGMRHTAITRLAEAGVPIAIIMKRAGHVTQRMSEHYTHISEQAERARIRLVSENKRRPITSVRPTVMPSKQTA
jgi:integrase